MALTAHSLTTTSGPNYIDLNWVLHDSERNAQVYYDLGADVWASETSSFEDAELIGEGVTSFRHAGLPVGAQRWYWVQAKYIDESPASGGFFPDADTSPPAEGVLGEELVGTLAVPSVSGLEVEVGFGQNFLKWAVTETGEDFGYLALDTVEVHASTVNDRDSENSPDGVLKVAEGENTAIHPNATGAAQYYWIRPRHVNGTFGDWYPSSPTAGIAAAATVGGSASGGYVKLPGGVIIQYGYAQANTHVTYPIPFPNAYWNVLVSSTYGNNPDYCQVVNTYQSDNNGFDPHLYTVNNTDIQEVSSGTIFFWMAIGH